MFIKLEKGSFNNYVDKIGGGQKLSVIVHAWGKIIVQAKGGGGQKMVKFGPDSRWMIPNWKLPFDPILTAL